MYIQITTHCNMTCAHCCFSCEPGKGEHMSWDVFKKAVAMACELGEYITIGGGEPTMHPEFWRFLWHAITEASFAKLGWRDGGGVYIVTNGSITKTALRLAALARDGMVGARLSLDEHHDGIDAEVEDAFNAHGSYRRLDGDLRYVSLGNPDRIIKAGRAVETGVGVVDECICDDLFVAPSGELYVCGCQDAPVLGNVRNMGRDALRELAQVSDIGSACWRVIAYQLTDLGDEAEDCLHLVELGQQWQARKAELAEEAA